MKETVYILIGREGDLSDRFLTFINNLLIKQTQLISQGPLKKLQNRKKCGGFFDCLKRLGKMQFSSINNLIT